VELVQKIAKANKCQDFEFAKNKEEEQSLWSARKQVLWSMLALKEDENSQVWSTDVAVPISRLPELIGKSTMLLQSDNIQTELYSQRSRRRTWKLSAYLRVHLGTLEMATSTLVLCIIAKSQGRRRRF